MSSATFATLLTLAAYVTLPALIVLGAVWLTNRDGRALPDGAISSRLQRTGLPLPFVIGVSVILVVAFANGPTGTAETVTGRVVASRIAKSGFQLTLFFENGETTHVTSPRQLPNQTQIECSRQHARFTGGSIYKCQPTR